VSPTRPELTRRARSAAAEAALRQGFTLLEVLLALLLASMLLIVLTTAVDFQLRAVDVSRTDVEEAQLARVLLHRIANDLRGAVRYRPINYDELISKSSGSSEPAGGGEESTGEATGETGESEGLFAEDSGSENAEDSGSAAETDTEEVETEAAPGVPQSTPGIYGGPDWIQIDNCHLPRLEQIESLLAPTEELTQTSGIGNVKTVEYYVISADEATYTTDGTEPAGGLVRRESDRAASLLAAEIGGLEETDCDTPPIASEVLAVEFLYSNGTEWVDSWDTTESGGLPVAVEVSIAIRRVRSRKEQRALREGATYQASLEEEPSLIYRQIVHLPTAEPTSSGTEETF
jgi:prepilin-type N-terminal cleavage/methylation domain-containing protein